MPQLIITRLLFLLIVSSPYFVIAQSGNLIPNSSFESYNALPDDLAQAPKCISSWKIPNLAGSSLPARPLSCKLQTQNQIIVLDSNVY